MTVNVTTAKTRHFIDYWTYIPGIIAFLLLFSSIYGLAFAQTLVNKRVELVEEESISLGQIELEPSRIGALRIDVTSSFHDYQANDWIVYEIQLIDSKGQIVASAIDEDWQESGTWYEDGQSGKWRESELKGGIDLRLSQPEKLDVAIQLLERKDFPGQTLNNHPVSFQVKVRQNVIDRRVLAWGSLWSGILGICAWYGTKTSGKKLLSKGIQDSDPQGRVTVGGKDNLVRVRIKSKLDENTPRIVMLNLVITNGYGEKVYDTNYRIPVRITRSDREVKGEIDTKLFFLLEPYSSYSFQVKIQPDNPVDLTYLEVRQGCKTVKAVNVTTIK